MKSLYFRNLCLFAINIFLFLFSLFILQQGDRNADFNSDEVLFDNTSTITGDSTSDKADFFSYSYFRGQRAFVSCEKLDVYCSRLKLNHIYSDSSVRVVFEFVTDSLFKDYFNSVKYNPDKVHAILLWVDEFRYYGSKDTSKYAVIYPAVFDYWLNKLSNILSAACADQPDLKYDKRFCYLYQRFEDAKFSVAINYSTSEKIIENMISSKWAYLYDRFWLETSLGFRIILFMGFLIVTISFSHTALCLIIKIKHWMKVKK